MSHEIGEREGTGKEEVFPKSLGMCRRQEYFKLIRYTQGVECKGFSLWCSGGRLLFSNLPEGHIGSCPIQAQKTKAIQEWVSSSFSLWQPSRFGVPGSGLISFLVVNANKIFLRGRPHSWARPQDKILLHDLNKDTAVLYLQLQFSWLNENQFTSNLCFEDERFTKFNDDKGVVERREANYFQKF